MVNFTLLLAALWLCFAQLHAALSFKFTLEQFTREVQGFRFAVTRESRFAHTLNIKCADCAHTKVPPNYIEIYVYGKKWTSDKCTRGFCPPTVSAPMLKDFRMVTWQDWENGLDFAIGFPAGSKIELKMTRKPIFGGGAWPAFLSTGKAEILRSVHFVVMGKIVEAQTFNYETTNRMVVVEDYDPWVVFAARRALEEYYVKVPFANDYFARLKTLFYFADDYEFIGIQKLILSQQFASLTTARFPDVLAFVLSLKKDRYGLVKRSIDTLAAHYCDNMKTIKLSTLIQETELSLSCLNRDDETTAY
jgi:hypothetical protein